jgi:hypothetical protein
LTIYTLASADKEAASLRSASDGTWAVIQVAFLNGQQSPTIENAEADFNVLGVQMRIFHAFGVNLQYPSVPRVEIPFTWWRRKLRVK